MASGVFTLKQQQRALLQGAWTNQKPLAVNYFVVAGGGGGGSGNTGGGGGGGGLLEGNIAVASGTSITVTVGGGGSGGSGTQVNGNAGSNSVFGSITASGGGGGTAAGQTPTAQGGSGGGGAGNGSGCFGGQGTVGQGKNGGFGRNDLFPRAGGGGGAGSNGTDMFYQASSGGRAGNGGNGIASSITGTRTVYSGGGGGGGDSRGTPLATSVPGGSGGGGAGSLNSAGTAGTANTGGGGGGGGFVNPTFYDGGAGGSGIVILSYPDIYNAAASTTGSPTISTSGSGSLYFDGNDDYVTYPASTPLNIGSGDFTVEGWFYTTSATTQQGIVNVWASTQFQVEINTSGKIQCSWAPYSTSVYLITGATTISANTWYHFAYVRSGNNFTLYLNGTSDGTGTSSATTSSNNALYIGANSDGTRDFGGYISNIRIVKGTAVYTTNFTVSTIPLTAITNTSFLLSTVSGSNFVDSSTNAANPTVTGTPSWNALSPFATGLGYKNRTYTWTSSGSITF